MQKRSNFFFETIFGGWTIPWPFSKEAGVSHRWKGQALDGIFRGILPHICRRVRIVIIRGSRQVPAALATALGVSPCHWAWLSATISYITYHWVYIIEGVTWTLVTSVHGLVHYIMETFFRSYFVIWQNAEKGPLVNASCSRFSWDLTHDILQSQINWALVLSQDTQDVIAKTWNLGFFFKKKVENIRKKNDMLLVLFSRDESKFWTKHPCFGVII